MKDYILKKSKKIRTKTFTVWEADVKLGTKRVALEYISFNEAAKSVMVAPITKNNKLILIKKFCPAINNYEYVLPGGKVEKGDSLKRTVVKELSEEIGLKPRRLISLGPMKILPRYLVGTTFGFVGLDLISNSNFEKEDLDKNLKMEKFSLKKTIGLIKQNKIQDARTISFILKINTFYKNLFY